MDILISNMYSARPLSFNGKEGTTRDSFQWEISEGNEFYISTGNYMLNWRQEFLALWTSSFQICTLQDLCLSTGKKGQPGTHFNGKLQQLAYLSGRFSEEAELNGKDGTTRDSFQQEITSLGVLNLKQEFLAIWTSSF